MCDDCVLPAGVVESVGATEGGGSSVVDDVDDVDVVVEPRVVVVRGRVDGGAVAGAAVVGGIVASVVGVGGTSVVESTWAWAGAAVSSQSTTPASAAPLRMARR
jgi:hypothetical protein